MSNVPADKREFHLANPGIELKSDDTQLDVAAWRESVDTTLTTMDGRLADLNSDLDEVETKLDTINTTLSGVLTTRISAIKNIHDGKGFLAFNNNSSLASGSSINIYLETSAVAGSSPHLTIDTSGSDVYDFEFLEGPTVTSATGTSTEIFNKNRQSGNTSTVKDNEAIPASNKISTDVTVTADGKIISRDTISTGSKQGGLIHFNREFILKTSTKYVFRLTSRANSNRVHMNLDWYEPV
jgi:hypothetical protein